MKKATNDAAQQKQPTTSDPDAGQAQPAQGGDLQSVAAKLRQCADQLEAPQHAGAQAAPRDAIKSLLEMLIQIAPVILSRL